MWRGASEPGNKGAGAEGVFEAEMGRANRKGPEARTGGALGTGGSGGLSARRSGPVAPDVSVNVLKG